MNSSSVDILVTAAHKSLVSKLSLLSANFSNDQYAPGSEEGTSTGFWIDIALRWGDYDSHTAEKYSRAKFHDYETDDMTIDMKV